ncbi:MAG: hypothetical protein HOQ43_11610, partial [Glycomyces artemisiae]|nr:hypothetical protein [Glycomyces artemisiae]
MRQRIAFVLALPLAASGCTLFEREEEELDYGEYAEQLTDTRNESARLTGELDAAEARIVQECLEAQGFEVHNPDEFVSWDSGHHDTFMDEAPYAWFLPTVEEAELRGVWQWTNLDGAETLEDGVPWAAYEVYEDLRGYGMPEWFEEGAETPEFYTLGSREQFDWWAAYIGEDLARYQHGDLIGIEAEVDENGNQEGEQPPPGGCRRQMVEAVYADVEEARDEDFADWTYRPDMPFGDWEAMNERYADDTAGFEGDLIDCIEERGPVGWEFHRGHLRIHDFLYESGEGQNARFSFEDGAGAWPDPADDVPDADDTQGWLDFERDLAVVFAECGDESGYRDAAEHAGQQAQLRYYLESEEAV